MYKSPPFAFLKCSASNFDLIMSKLPNPNFTCFLVIDSDAAERVAVLSILEVDVMSHIFWQVSKVL